MADSCMEMAHRSRDEENPTERKRVHGEGGGFLDLARGGGWSVFRVSGVVLSRALGHENVTGVCYST